MKTLKTEVVVIGGGIIGTAVAYYLSKEGKDVILVERDGIASGSAGATDGYIVLQSKKPGLHLQMAMESSKIYSQLAEELGTDLEYLNCGGFFVIETLEELEVIKSVGKKQRDSGLDVKIIDIHEAKSMEPELSVDLVGASYSPMDSVINPLKVTFGYAKAAKRLGAKILTETEVTSIKLNNGKVEGVITNKGEIRANIVVNAAGSWAANVGKFVGLDLPIKPRRGQVLVTEPVSPFVKRIMLCGRYFCIKHKPELLKNLDEETQRLGLGFGIEQTENGNLLISNTREWAGFDRRNNVEGIVGILQHAVKILPKLKDVHIIRSFAGLRPYTPDGLPILGPVDGLKGFIMAAGHEGDGVALAPITGKAIGEYISYNDTSYPLEQLNFRRFK